MTKQLEYLCIFTFVMEDGELCFTKGKVYTGETVQHDSETMVLLTDDAGDKHYMRMSNMTKTFEDITDETY